MSGAKLTDEFKRDAVAEVVDRGYPVREVAERLGVSTKSIYTWQKHLRPHAAKLTSEHGAVKAGQWNAPTWIPKLLNCPATPILLGLLRSIWLRLIFLPVSNLARHFLH